MDKKGLKEALEVLEEALIDLAKNLKPFFANFSTYRTAKHYLKGLLSAVDRKNNWQIAENSLPPAAFVRKSLMECRSGKRFSYAACWRGPWF